MNIAANYKRELTQLTKNLPANKLKELLDFAGFLMAKKEGFTYTDIKDSAEYVKKLRAQEGKRIGSSEKFIAELIAWQKSNGPVYTI